MRVEHMTCLITDLLYVSCMLTLPINTRCCTTLGQHHTHMGTWNDSEHTVTTKPLKYSLSRKIQLLCTMSRVDLAEQRRSVRADVDVFTKSDHQSDGAQAANIHSP